MVSPSSDDLRTWADDAGPDTPLARLLLARGRLPLDLLQATLAEVRAARPGGWTLAVRLVERGLLEPSEVAEWHALLRSEAPLAQPTWPERRVERDDAWRPGAVVAEHRLVSRIGAGGMGAVDLAEHLPTGARRAIKSIPAGADPDLVVRFQREAEAMAAAGGHPAVARIHAVGSALGRLYLVLDLLPGGDLEQRLREGPLPAAEVARLGVALAGGLEHIHGLGLLHRDLKPSNVLFDDAGRPVLVDFGLVRSTGTSRLTRTGDLLGTPAYMAPEQALGLSREQDVRTDVHGLGAVLYRALAGQLPFQGATPIELLERVIHVVPAPPSSLVPGVPPALDVAILRALAKAPADRFQTAAALGAALSDALTGLAPGDTRGAARPRLRPGRGVVGLAGVGVLGLGLGLGLALRARPTVELQRPPRPRTPSLPRPPVATPAPGPTEVAPHPTRSALPATIEEILPPPDLPPDSIGEARASEWRTLERETPEFGKPLARLVLAQALKNDVLAADRPPGDPCALLAVQLLAAIARAGIQESGGAWRELAYLFELGVGVRRSDAQAARCYAAAADAGDDLAMILLGCALRDGALDQAVDRPRARALLRRVASGDTAVARKALAELALLEVEGDDQAALRELAGLLREEPGEVAALGMVHGRLGDPTTAEAVLRRHLTPSVTLSAANFVALHGLLLRAGRPVDAAQVLADLERYTGRGDVDLALGRLHRDAGRTAEAARWFEQVTHLRERVALNSVVEGAAELLSLCEAEAAAGRPAPRDAAAMVALLNGSYEGRARLARLRRARPR